MHYYNLWLRNCGGRRRERVRRKPVQSYVKHSIGTITPSLHLQYAQDQACSSHSLNDPSRWEVARLRRSAATGTLQEVHHSAISKARTCTDASEHYMPIYGALRPISWFVPGICWWRLLECFYPDWQSARSCLMLLDSSGFHPVAISVTQKKPI